MKKILRKFPTVRSFKKNKWLKFSAFTLAEVLIVLGIIGIIADMTIPTLKRDIDKTVYVTQLKKFYSTFQQGMQMAMVMEGVNSIDYTGLFDSTKLDETIKKTFNVTKACDTGETECTIFGYKHLDKTGNSNEFTESNSYNFYTADGMAIGLILGTECSESANDPNTYFCGAISVDVNGIKKPNVNGRDFFTFILDKDGSLYPEYGAKQAMAITGNLNGISSYWKAINKFCGDPGPTGKVTAGAGGNGCAARIMEEGWKMNY